MYLSEETWIKDATMIYIDQPVGTGFSWGEPLLTDMDEAATEFVYFVKKIWLLFPELTTKDLYMTGESYAGKYIPRFSWEILQQGSYFNLKASLVGDPYTAPLTQRLHMHIVPEALNIIDDSNMPQITALQKRCEEMIAPDLKNAGDACADIMNYIDAVSGSVLSYDNRIFDADWDMIENPVINYFSSEAGIQDATTLD